MFIINIAVNKEIDRIDADAVVRGARQTSSDAHHVFINNLLSFQSRIWLYCSVFMMHINKVEASAFRLSAVNYDVKAIKNCSISSYIWKLFVMPVYKCIK